jgi:hypothetical protein
MDKVGAMLKAGITATALGATRLSQESGDHLSSLYILEFTISYATQHAPL